MRVNVWGRVYMKLPQIIVLVEQAHSFPQYLDQFTIYWQAFRSTAQICVYCKMVGYIKLFMEIDAWREFLKNTIYIVWRCLETPYAASAWGIRSPVLGLWVRGSLRSNYHGSPLNKQPVMNAADAVTTRGINKQHGDDDVYSAFTAPGEV